MRDRKDSAYKLENGLRFSFTASPEFSARSNAGWAAITAGASFDDIQGLGEQISVDFVEPLAKADASRNALIHDDGRIPFHQRGLGIHMYAQVTAITHQKKWGQMIEQKGQAT